MHRAISYINIAWRSALCQRHNDNAKAWQAPWSARPPANDGIQAGFLTLGGVDFGEVIQRMIP
jgi:hypothetical protein